MEQKLNITNDKVLHPISLVVLFFSLLAASPVLNSVTYSKEQKGSFQAEVAAIDNVT